MSTRFDDLIVNYSRKTLQITGMININNVYANGLIPKANSSLFRYSISEFSVFIFTLLCALNDFAPCYASQLMICFVKNAVDQRTVRPVESSGRAGSRYNQRDQSRCRSEQKLKTQSNI